MQWLALIFSPRTWSYHQRKKLKILTGVIIVGVLTAAVVGLGFYFSHGRPFQGGH